MVDPDPRWIGAALAERAPVLFGVTGSGPSLALIEAYEGAGGRYVPMAGEAAAGLAAAGAWMASDDPAAAVAIKGPGVANLVPAISFAHLERRPLLTISESNPIGAPAARRHKHIDHRALLTPLVRCHSPAVHDVEGLDELLGAASAPVAGPVHMDLAIGSEPQLQVPDAAPWEVVDAGSIGELGRACLVIGASGSDWAAETSLEDLDLPVFTTARARGIIDESSRNAAGVFTGVGGPASVEKAVIAAADTVLAIGVAAEELLGVPGAQWLPVRPEDGHEVVGRAAATPWEASLVESARAEERRALESPDWWPGDVADALDALDGPLVVVADTGAFATFLEHRWKVTSERRADGSPNGRYMGVAIGLTIGWATAQRSPVYCVVGDGGAPSHFVELRTAAQLGLAVCVVVVADGRFSSVIGSRSGPAPTAGLVPFTDWVGTARSLGIDADRVSSSDGLRRLLSAWDRQHPLVIEARFDEWDTRPLGRVRG